MHRTVLLTSLVAACGTPAVAGDLQLATVHHAEPGQNMLTGHVYYNASTGERVITLQGQPSGVNETGRPAEPGRRGAELNPVWLAQSYDPCQPAGSGGGLLYMADDPDRDPSDPAFDYATGARYLDWGDIAPDTLIEAVRFSYASAHLDPDYEGVPGFGATLLYSEVDNGYNSGCMSVSALSITIRDLPGSNGPPAMFTGWEITVDLMADPSNPMSVELGDTDGDGQGAAFFNPFAYTDLDGDGLHDFSHSIVFHQPGSFDFDGDGVPDGDPATAASTFLFLATPDGVVTQDPNDPGVDIITDIAPPPSAQGLEDGFDIYADAANAPGFEGDYLGTFWFGGFNCPDAADPEPRPFASFVHGLYSFSTATEPCPADINGDGAINFNDTIAYLGLFNIQDPAADITDDGAVNFNDLVAFLGIFNSGCP